MQRRVMTESTSFGTTRGSSASAFEANAANSNFAAMLSVCRMLRNVSRITSMFLNVALTLRVKRPHHAERDGYFVGMLFLSHGMA